MTMSTEEYRRAKEALVKPKESGLSDEDVVVLMEATEEYDNQHLQGQFPQQQQQAPAEEPAPELALKLNPAFNILPQVVATTPPRTELPPRHQADIGTDIVVYEAPVRHVQTELLNKPELIPLLSPDGGVMSPEDIANLSTSDPIYQAYNDLRFTQAKQEFEKQGRSAVRYSQMSTSQGGIGDRLKAGVAALKPAGDAGTSFVLGLDQAATFGVGGQVLKTLGSEDDVEHMREAQEAHPVAGAAGQLTGMLSPVSPSNQLFSWLQRGAGGALTRAGAGGLERGLAQTGGAAVAGSGVQALQEGVEAGGRALRGENPQSGAGSRVLGAGELSGGIDAGARLVGGGVGALAGQARRWIGEGPRYGGIPGQLERQGVEFKVGEGIQLSPDTQRLVEEARNLDLKDPANVAARGIAPDVVKGAQEEVDAAKRYAVENQQRFLSTPEGRKKYRPTNLVNETVKQLNQLHPTVEGKPRPIPGNESVIKDVSNVLNKATQAVRPGKVEGAVNLTPEQAEIYLDKDNAESLRRQLKGEPGKDATRVQFDEFRDKSLGKPEKGLAEDLRARGVDTVSLVPREYTATELQDQIDGIEGYKTSSGRTEPPRQIMDLDQAARKDRDAIVMDGQPGAWSALQNRISQRTQEAKDLQRLATNNRGEEGAIELISQHGRPTTSAGDMLTAEALQKAADRGGVREELNRARRMNRELAVQEAGRIGGKPLSGIAEVRAPWSPTGAFDALALRVGYPGLQGVSGQQLGNKLSGASRLGPGMVGQQGQDEEQKR